MICLYKIFFCIHIIVDVRKCIDYRKMLAIFNTVTNSNSPNCSVVPDYQEAQSYSNRDHSDKLYDFSDFSFNDFSLVVNI